MAESPPDPGELIEALKAAGLTIATCESITGGLIAAALTSVPGSSAVVRGGLVTYATEVKTTLAGLDPAWIEQYGVINAETAQQLALAARSRCGADLGLGITGVAGPEGQDGAAVGTVWLALAGPPEVTGDEVITQCLALAGDRAEIRQQSVDRGILLVLRVLSQ